MRKLIASVALAGLLLAARPALAGDCSLQTRLTPAAGTTATVATGGTAVTVATGPFNGGYVTNPLNTAAQGVTAENAYLDMVGTPGSTDANANGTTILLQAGQTFFLPCAVSAVVKVNAASSGHKLTVVIW